MSLCTAVHRHKVPMSHAQSHSCSLRAGFVVSLPRCPVAEFIVRLLRRLCVGLGGRHTRSGPPHSALFSSAAAGCRLLSSAGSRPADWLQSADTALRQLVRQLVRTRRQRYLSHRRICGGDFMLTFATPREIINEDCFNV